MAHICSQLINLESFLIYFENRKIKNKEKKGNNELFEIFFELSFKTRRS